jgi:branched-chain amino acid aminotransferase
MQIYLNGKLVPESKAKVSVFDHGLLYGDGVFEYAWWLPAAWEPWG